MGKVTVNGRELTHKEKQDIFLSISMRLGFIETETIYRAVDLQKSDKDFRPKVLSTEQMKLIISLEELMNEILLG